MDASGPVRLYQAVHKAQRNAIKQLLPVPVIREVLNFYLKRQVDESGDPTDTEQQPNVNDNITNAQKATFAIASKLEKALQEKVVSKQMLWDYVKRKFAIDSRNDMSEVQWTQLSAELKAAETTPKLFEELVKRIKDTLSEAADT